jgi:hypothetical protein
MRPILALLLFSHLAVSSTAAEKAPSVQVSLYAFAYAPGHESVHLPNGTEFTPVRLSTANIVGPIKSTVVGGNLIIHGDPVDGPDGTTVHPVLSRCPIKEGIRKAVVVLLPTTTNDKASYSSMVFDHDLRDFPLGVYRIVNLASKPIRGAVGSAVVKTKPGGIANLKLDGEPGSVVPVRFEYYENKRWNRLTETRAAIRDDRRWLMFVYQDPRSGRMNIRSIPDRTRMPSSPDDPGAP